MRMSKRPAKKDLLRRAAEMLLGKEPEPEPGTAAPPATPQATPSTEELLHDLQVHQIELEMQNEALQHTQVALEESRDRYKNLYDFAPVGYITLARDGLICEANLTASALLDTVRSKLMRSRFETFIAPSHHDQWRRRISSTWQTRNEQSLKCEMLMQRRDGSQFPAQLQCVVLEMSGASPVVRIAFTDITERMHAEEQQRIAAIAFESHEGMIVTNAQGVIVSVNRAFTTLTGYSMAEVEGKRADLLCTGQQNAARVKEIVQALMSTHYWQGEVWSHRKNGQSYAAWLTITAVTTPDGYISHYVGTFSDTTQNSEAIADIRRLAFYDPLTQLPNRRLLQDRLGQALAAASRSGMQGAILFLDLDNFKNLNDTRGHDVGDLLLNKVAQRLRINLRQGDTVARLGGDEFVMILENLSLDAGEAAILAKQIGEKLNQVIAEPINLGNGDFNCTTSIGVRLFNAQDSVQELLKHADLALYQAKTDGRNILRFYDPSMQAALDERSQLELELRFALQRGQFQLYYQPQYDHTGRITGAEALLRWHHPKRGLVLPDEFIALAERIELIVPIGRWIMESACTQLNEWSGCKATSDLKLTLNISAHQFQQPDFVGQVREVLESSGVRPAHLTFELLESMVQMDVTETIEKMRIIKQWGVHFSIDDFGTGCSSVSCLTRLLLDQLKIDKSFVANLPHRDDDANIVKAIIAMAESLGLDVMAEGVETPEQRSFLERHGCHAYQGYLFNRPMPAEDLTVLLRRI